jgi:hypothetical protein
MLLYRFMKAVSLLSDAVSAKSFDQAKIDAHKKKVIAKLNEVEDTLEHYITDRCAGLF